MEQQLTKEEVQQHIKSAYDSVDLINRLREKQTLTSDEASSLQRNIDHLKIMMGKDWFASGLKAAQKKEINTIIA